MIAAVKNVSFIGTNKNYNAIQMVNFAFGLIYIVIGFLSMAALCVYFLSRCCKKKLKK